MVIMTGFSNSRSSVGHLLVPHCRAVDTIPEPSSVLQEQDHSWMDDHGMCMCITGTYDSLILSWSPTGKQVTDVVINIGHHPDCAVIASKHIH